ncbi:hypothetical protein AVEN_2861-1 [Araneus ventricosus]|uniref:Uncharacterized protein n=1 Tax=Araneus ventricosus TaxID=182803 RepID=A0A4Y2DUD2_ARAVE|nr:hypothetical protein AVEN_2861-1 [Araneus ventricosus]
MSCRNTEGRYKTSRLNERSIDAKVHHRDSFQPRYSANTESRRPFSLRIRISNQHRGDGSPCVYLSSLCLPFPPFLNTLPSEARGVVHELSPGDSSSSCTNHPTTVVHLPPW